MSIRTILKNSRPDEPASVDPPTKRRLPPLRSLVAFEAAARHANFTLAAAELAVTPSAISHQIQTLEDFLGTKLFLRQPGQIALSSTGILYRSEVEAALNALADATQRIAPQSQTNTLLILSSPSFAAKWLQPRLPRFMAEHPDIRLRVATIANSASIATIRFDVAICYEVPVIADMNVTPFTSERIRPLCSPGLASALSLRTLSDLRRATLIHSANSVTWDAFFRQLGASSIRPYNEMWLDRSTMAIEAAVAGLGVALESDILTQNECAEGQLVAPFDDEQASITANAYHLVTPRGYRSRHYCAAFVDWLRASISPGNQPPAAVG